MNRDIAVITWRAVCKSDDIMGLPPTGRLLEEFARRIEATEREACALACEAFGRTLEVDLGPNFAEEIRAR